LKPAVPNSNFLGIEEHLEGNRWSACGFFLPIFLPVYATEKKSSGCPDGVLLVSLAGSLLLLITLCASATRVILLRIHVIP